MRVYVYLEKNQRNILKLNVKFKSGKKVKQFNSYFLIVFLLLGVSDFQFIFFSFIFFYEWKFITTMNENNFIYNKVTRMKVIIKVLVSIMKISRNFQI